MASLLKHRYKYRLFISISIDKRIKAYNFVRKQATNKFVNHFIHLRYVTWIGLKFIWNISNRESWNISKISRCHEIFQMEIFQPTSLLDGNVSLLKAGLMLKPLQELLSISKTLLLKTNARRSNTKFVCSLTFQIIP